MSGPEYQVVVSFRIERMAAPMDRWLRDLRGQLAAWAEHHAVNFADLDVAVRVIGAQGESGADEGRWDAPPSHQNAPGTSKGAV